MRTKYLQTLFFLVVVVAFHALLLKILLPPELPLLSGASWLCRVRVLPPTPKPSAVVLFLLVLLLPLHFIFGFFVLST